MMKTSSPLCLFFLGVLFPEAEAQPQRRVDLYNPSLLELPKIAKRLYDPEIVQKLTPKNAEKLYNPEVVQKLTSKNAEKLYNLEIVQKLTTRNPDTLHNTELVQKRVGIFQIP